MSTRHLKLDSFSAFRLAGVCAALCLGLLHGPGLQAGENEADLAKRILAATGVKGGLVVHVGCGDGKLTAALRVSDSFLVQGLDAKAANVAKAREHIRTLGFYGRVTADQHDGDRLPYIDNLVNLLVCDYTDGRAREIPMAEILRVLAPDGVAYLKKDGQWTKTVKPRPKEIDEWTHALHDAGNNAVAHDSVIAPLGRFQWTGGPLYSRHHDHMSALSAMVSANGRIFYIFDEAPRPSILIPPQWVLTARDAFNGMVLWRRPIERWHDHLWPLKAGPQILTRRLVAVGDRVYLTLGIDAPLSALDAATGETIRNYEGTKAAEEVLCHDGVLFLSVAATGQPLRSDPEKTLPNWPRVAVINPLWTDAPRTVMAVEADSGKMLWKKESTVVSMSLAADGQRVLFHDGERIQCLDRRNGQSLWASDPMPRRELMRSSGGVTLVVYDDVILYDGQTKVDDAKEAGITAMFALSAKDGKTLWKAEHPPCGHMGTPVDILVLNGVVWCGAVAQPGDSGIMTGRDLHTGKVVKEFGPDVSTHWFHHRCYRAKATDNYPLFSRTGIEFIDVASKQWTCHHWTRGACLYGIMPCNGLVYTGPHPCACYSESKLSGFQALAPISKTRPVLIPEGERLERGPVYDAEIKNPSPKDGDDWPAYRHDSARSGVTKAAVPAADLNRLWQTDLGGKLSSVVVADGRLFVASVNAHTVHSLDAVSGKPLWSFTAGGRVDSPPTLWQGRVLFGSADGCVYCLRASDGALAWRFHAAPADQRMGAFEQIESVWPVHGSVLVQNDAVYCVAGRSMFLDGGLRFLQLDPKTGQKLSETVLDDRDPVTGRNLQSDIKGLNMPVALPDILSSDGRYVYMRSLPFDMQGKRKVVGVVPLAKREGDDLHLFSPTGFLDDTLWHRTYWVYGRAFASGAGGYYLAGRTNPAGRLLVFDDKTVYGYGRHWDLYRWTTPLEFHLFATSKNPEVLKTGAEPKTETVNGKVKVAPGSPPGTRFGCAWSDELSVQATAMVKAGEALFVAGPPDVVDEEKAAKAPRDPQMQKKLAEQEAAFEGRKGALLVAVSAADGKKLATYRLDSLPVFDGMVVANGRLYLSTADGKVISLGAGDGQPMQAAPDDVVKPQSP